MSKNAYFPQPDEIPGYPTVLTPQDPIDVIPRKQSLNNPNHIFLGYRRFNLLNIPYSLPKDCLGVSLSIFLYSLMMVCTCFLFMTIVTNRIHLILIISSSFILFILNLYLIIYLSTSDPGFFIPSDKIETPDKEQLYAQSSTSMIELKMCKSCHIIKNLRVFHCRKCGLCVLRHDHHCDWLSNCIGVNNHKTFLFIIYTCLLHCTIFILFIIYTIFEYKSSMSMRQYFFCVLDLGIITVITVIFLSLALYQLYFICTNQTTSESLKRNDLQQNQFTTGSIYKNISEFFKDPLGYKNRFLFNSVSADLIGKAKLVREELANEFTNDPKEIELSVKKEKYLFL